MHPSRIPLFAASFTLLLLSSQSALALDTFLLGPRAMGMGGANVASVDNTTAQYYNPAAFGYMGRTTEKGERISIDNNNLGRKNIGVDINAAAGYRLHNEFGQYLDSLDQALLTDVSAGIDDRDALVNLVDLVGNLAGLDQENNAITADASGGLGVRVGHFATGVWSFAQASGQVTEIDTFNLGTDTAVDISTSLTGPETNPDGWSDDGSAAYFSTSDYNTLVKALGGDAAAQEAVDKIDFVAAREGLDPTLSLDIANIIEVMDAQTGTSTLDQNTTTVLLSGFGHAEIPISYGRAINDHLSFGGNIKLMRGRVYGTKVLVFDNDSDDIIAESDENYEQSDAVGVDFGMLMRLEKFNFGLIGRNLNSPEFDGFTVVNPVDPDDSTRIEDVTLDPQAVAGVAFIPTETIVLEVDYDLTRNETTLQGYDTQNIRFGFEWDAGRVLALRGGAYKNLVEDDIDWVYTAGLGLNLWAMRLDVAGAFSDEKTEFDGDDYPTVSRLSAQLSFDF